MENNEKKQNEETTFDGLMLDLGFNEDKLNALYTSFGMNVEGLKAANEAEMKCPLLRHLQQRHWIMPDQTFEQLLEIRCEFGSSSYKPLIGDTQNNPRIGYGMLGYAPSLEDLNLGFKPKDEDLN